MSNCIITVKIGENLIFEIDPNESLTAESITPLIKSLDVNTLRIIYSNLKNELDFSAVFENQDSSLVEAGRLFWESKVEEWKNDVKEFKDSADKTDKKDRSGMFPTPLAVLRTLTDPQQVRILSAFTSSLSTKTEVVANGNFLIDPLDAYKSSPYTVQQFKSLVIPSLSTQYSYLFDALMAIPGMETLRFSIAFADSMPDVDKVKNPQGVYITPDNIIQIILPNSYYKRSQSGPSGDMYASITGNPVKLEALAMTVLHEITHAVFTELYNSNAFFKKELTIMYKAYSEHYDKITKADIKKRLGKYSDIQEFIADIFINRSLQTELSKIPGLGKQYSTDVAGDLQSLINMLLPPELKLDNNLLNEILQFVTYSKPSRELRVSEESIDRDSLKADYERNLYYNQGGEEQDVAPASGYDSKWGNDSKAIWIREQYVSRVKTDTNTTINLMYNLVDKDVNDYKITNMKSQDLALLPWMEYDKETKEWHEVGVLAQDGVSISDSKGKPRKHRIIRNDADEIEDVVIDGVTYQVEERTQYQPVVYVNDKKSRIVLARFKPGANGSNTISVPFKFIRGIRKFDKTFFNHNHDYQVDIDKLTEELLALQAKYADEGEAAVAERTEYKGKQIATALANKKKAEDTKEEMKALYIDAKYYHERAEGDFYLNVSKEDYEESGREVKEGMEFSDKKTATWTFREDKKGDFHQNLNFQKFFLIFDPDLATSFVENVGQLEGLIGSGDMVRVKMNQKSKEGVVVPYNQWFPVHSKVAGGLMVATKEGVGMVLSYNQILSYAKNNQSPSGEILANKLIEARDTFYEHIYEDYTDDKVETDEEGNPIEPSTEDEEGKNIEGKKKNEVKKRIRNEVLKKSMMSYDKEFHKMEKETAEDSITRFNKNQKILRDRIVPGKTFVKVKRWFLPKGKKKKQRYTTIELVVAISDKGLVTYREKEGKITTAFNNFDADYDDDQYEMTYLLEDMTEAKELYDSCDALKKQLHDNYTRDAFMNVGTEEAPDYQPVKDDDEIAWSKQFVNIGTVKDPNMVRVWDKKVNPTSYKDVFDLTRVINNKTINDLRKGDVVAIKIDKSKGKNKDIDVDYYFRKVIRVTPDGMIVVAEKSNTDTKFEGKKGKSITRKAGYYTRYLSPDQIMIIGYNLDSTLSDNGSYASEFHQEMLDKRLFILNQFSKDFKRDNFSYMKAEYAKKQNANWAGWLAESDNPKKYNERYVPLTNKILEENEDKKIIKDEDIVFLDRNKKPVATADDAIWVKTIWFGESEGWIERGIGAKGKTYKAGEVFVKNKEGKLAFVEGLKNYIYTGDSILKKYRGKDNKRKTWSSPIWSVQDEFVEVINKDGSISPVPLSEIAGIRFSTRNDGLTGFKRKDKILTILGLKKQKGKADKVITEEQPVLVEEEEPPFSKDMGRKSSADSLRALYEMGNRLQTLNPDVKLNFVNKLQVKEILKATNHDYNTARAFVLNGEVYINTDKASVSDIIHEYAHVFLATLKYDNLPLYEAIVSAAKNHSLFTEIQEHYPHLSGSDLYEEIFVTLLGEQLAGKNKNVSKELQNGFELYTRDKATAIFNLNAEEDLLHNIDPAKILKMSLLEVINMVGDVVMTNRISSFNEGGEMKFTTALDSIKSQLYKLGLLIENCYG